MKNTIIYFKESIQNEYKHNGLISAVLWTIVLPIGITASVITQLIMGEKIKF